ncbi:hypothetical protein ACH5RR_014724 [Cinchona calisaya]|uniref:Wax synthase domain-containing protein n=1 Tax=Cinchona calisaya TaxID=153742 RepID=A0ABD2ZU72_9GENT
MLCPGNNYFAINGLMELLLASVAALARAVMKVELEPQFDEPYLATSLQDFWGRRWNLMVSNIMRPTIYQPVRSFCTRVAGAKWASIPAVLVTFLVSGLMHELIFYNYLRHKPTGEITCFFLVNGLSLAVEIGIKNILNGRFLLPKILSRSLTLTFVVCTSFWLFFSPLLRAKADVQGCRETLAIIEFFKSGRLISPNDFSCPFFE